MDASIMVIIGMLGGLAVGFGAGYGVREICRNAGAPGSACARSGDHAGFRPYPLPIYHRQMSHLPWEPCRAHSISLMSFDMGRVANDFRRPLSEPGGAMR